MLSLFSQVYPSVSISFKLQVDIDQSKEYLWLDTKEQKHKCLKFCRALYLYNFEYFFQTVTVHMTEEEMENFVFAVLPKKTAAKMQKELQDLVNNLLLIQMHVFWSHAMLSCTIKHFFLFICFRRSSVLINAVVPSMIFLPHLLC